MSKVVSMDARKFVKFINESAQSQLAALNRCVRALGEKVNKRFNLVAAHRTSLLFEDLDDNTYHVADYRYGKNRRITISNVCPIEITESKKEHVFQNACVELVNYLSEDKQKEAESAFRKLEGCRFRPTVADDEGYVITKDGQRRRIYQTVAEDNDDLSEVVDVIDEWVIGDNVVVEENGSINAIFTDGDTIKFPSVEPIKRHIVAEQMKKTARNSFRSPKFQAFIHNVAAMVSNDKLRDAIAESAKFMKEYQEFCMLNLNEMNELVDKTLAMQNIYNHLLVEDVALLVYRSNLKVNKRDILEAWEKVAKITSSPILLESVNQMAQHGNFEEIYDDFLETVLNEEKEYDDIVRNYIGLILQRMREVKEARDEKDERFERAYEKLNELYENASDPATADEETMNTLYDIALKLAERKGGMESAQLSDFDLDETGDNIDDADIRFVSNYLSDETEKDEEGGENEKEGEEGSGGGINLGGLGGPEGGEAELEGEEGLGEGEEGEGAEEGEKGEEKEGKAEEEELNKLLAAHKDKSAVEVLEEEYKRINEQFDELMKKEGRQKVVDMIGAYVMRCEALNAPVLAESFAALISDDDPYADFVMAEPAVTGINGLYGARKSDEDEGEDKTVEEAQRKAPTAAKKRTRPDMTKKSLMKEDESEEEEVVEDEAGEEVDTDNEPLEEGVSVTVVSADSKEDLDTFSSAIEKVFGSIEPDDLQKVGTKEDEEEVIQDCEQASSKKTPLEEEDEDKGDEEEEEEPVEEGIDYGVKGKTNTPKDYNKDSDAAPKNPKPKVKKDDSLGNEAGKLKKTKTGKNVVEDKRKNKKPTFGFGPFKK